MFKIESYVTPILLSYVDKYVKDFKPADAQVSLWGGGVALHNLVLKADVLQKEVALPFTLVSGRIHELLIQVPWTKVMSEPIIVTIDTIECVLSLNPPCDAESPATAASPEPGRKSQPMEAPPGYMQALVRRIVNNIALRVHHLIVKYVQDDIVLSLNVKHLAVDSAGPDWEPAFADIDQIGPMIRRLVRLDDLTLCLDKSDTDGKIRFFQEPLLYRCQLDFRVRTQLLSANTRRATNLNVQLRSGKLAFSVSNEQVILLIRLLNERPAPADRASASAPKPAAPALPNTSSGNSAEPARQESWSEWAWSWLPSLADRETGVEETPVVPTPLPVSLSAYFDDVSLMFKLMETEGTNRKRPRPVLELCAAHAALVTNFCTPTELRVRFLARELTARSQGKCVCGYATYKTSQLEPMIFLQKAPRPDSSKEQQPWTWPEHLLDEKVEMSATSIGENQPAQLSMSPAPSTLSSTVGVSSAGLASSTKQSSAAGLISATEQTTSQISDLTENLSIIIPDMPEKDRDKVDDLLANMGPLVYVDYVHERKPSNPNINAYENPPMDFEYSDWVEECSISVVVEPVDVRICTDLMHRVAVITNIFKEHELESPHPPKRVLTVEEKDSLSENLPQRCFKVDMRQMRVRLMPWDHSQSERPTHYNIILEVVLPNTNVIVLVPLYAHRVCSAACQMPDDEGPLWQGARTHVTLTVKGMQARLTNISGTESRPCARADFSVVTHHLLFKKFFQERNSIEFSYQLKIKELSVCGSSARLQAAAEVLLSLILQRRSVPLKHTTLPMDALNDEDAVAIDITLEGLSVRGFLTRDVNTNMVTLKSAKITALHEPKDGELKQAWLLSAPDAPSSNPYFRMALQWCNQKMHNSFDYCGLWTESLAMSVDPLLVSFLAYQPEVKSEASLAAALKSMVPADATHVTFRRRSVPATTRGRPSSVGAELVHIRSRSQCSSDPSDKKESHKMPHIAPKHTMPKATWLSEERMTMLHERMRDLLINVELGLAVVYVTLSTVSALDCATLRDAMERHASSENRVLGICLGRLMINSNVLLKGLWDLVRPDGPAYVVDKPEKESFPWKIKLADVSCYTLKLKPGSVPGISEVKGQENAGASGSLKSRLKIPMIALPKTVLELVTTTITISVVTKKVMYKKISMKERTRKAKEAPADQREEYFMAGKDFKPSTLKDFLRGPVEGLPKGPEEKKSTQDLKAEAYNPASITIEPGPVVSLGINLHADTPPVLIRLEQDQVHIVFAAIHCFSHIATLLKRPMLTVPRTGFASSYTLEDRTIIGSVSEVEESPSVITNTSEEMIAIFDRTVVQKIPLKTFFWLQWVVSRVTLVLCSETVKLVLAIEDVINTVDIQTEYNQLKIKLSSLSIKHFKRNEVREDEWVMGVLGGRVLEAREPAKAEEDDDFLAITITQAQIAALPPSWKVELHPKLLELDPSGDSIWEVYATLAPLEAVLQPNIIENLMTSINEMSPRAFCELSNNLSSVDMQWPYFYLKAGGLRLLVVGEDTESLKETNDTVVLTVGQVNVNPHPENPISRRGVNAGADGNWMAANGGFEGRQYEVVISKLSVETSRFNKIKLVEAASGVAKTGTGAENPALKWTQKIELPKMEHILYPMELSCILAPALHTNGVLTCGPAVELNLVSDCSLEFKIAQLVLLQQLGDEFTEVINEIRFSNSCIRRPDVCPYAMYMMTDSEPSSAHTVLDNLASESKFSDSGVETTATSSSKTKFTDDIRMRRSLSVVFVDTLDPSQFLEVFVTMGVVDLALNVDDDGSPELVALRPLEYDSAAQKKQEAEKDRKKKQKEKNDTIEVVESTASITSRLDKASTRHTRMTLPKNKVVTTLHLIHATLFQPNIYYWKRRTQKTLQVSLFNTTIALGTRDEAGNFRDLLLSTAKGVSDPVTGIPPALATFKLVAPTASAISLGPRGYVNFDIERPLQIDISTNKLMRLMRILDFVKRNLAVPETRELKQRETPFLLFKFKKQLSDKGIETITVQTSQLSVCGHEGVVGWDNASVQINASHRPEKNVSAKLLMTALLVAAGSAEDMRHVVLQPLVLGVKAEAIWEAWRRAEGGLSARQPTVKIGVELDHITIDLRPCELAAVRRLRKSVEELVKNQQMLSAPKIRKYPTRRMSLSEEHFRDWSLTSMNEPSQSSLRAYNQPAERKSELTLRIVEPGATQPQSRHESSILKMSVLEPQHQPVQSSAPSRDVLEPPLHVWKPQNSDLFVADVDVSEHYYKDDLRSGAFKILTGDQLPMAYQVVLSGDAVSWCYPHPRAITRIVAYPLPGQDTEIDCVLELYSTMVERWEPHTYFKLPVGDPRDIQLLVRAPETVFGTLWRFRVCMDPEPTRPPFEFHMRRFFPKTDAFKVTEEADETENVKSESGVSAEQLSGVVRVDSYFSPRLLPRTKLVARCACLLVHLHNSLPPRTSNATYLEGYYVSKPLMKTHRVLTIATRNTAAHALLQSPAGKLLVVDTSFSCDVIDSSTGAMEEAIEEFRLQGSMSVKESLSSARARVMTTGIVMAMQVMRLRTLQALALDWQAAYDQYIRELSKGFDAEVLDATNKSTREVAKVTALALDGRVCLWVHNSCSTVLRVGQEETDEVVPLGAGVRLAYRWRSPTAPKRLRFSLAGPSTNWQWSSSVPFVAGCHKLRIEIPESENGKHCAMSAFLRVIVEDLEGGRYMHLSGRLVLANMLRENLLYKVRSHAMDNQQWYTVTSGELHSETVGRSVICSGECEMVLKVKFRSTGHTCWSGDIPLKECPKENVPWLVKVPTDGVYEYVSVWCRVVRGRTDGRILATVWPLYVLCSHLSLDTDVRIVTDAIASTEESPPPPPAEHQTIPGRGASTHLQAPGTTSSRHSLSFKYRNLGSPVTREAVPMHYGVTDTSVFDKRLHVMNIEEVIKDIKKCLACSGKNAKKSWPYSVVKKYWKDEWAPAALQPRCDVSVRYAAVVAGGGCSLQLQLSPVVLLCNASPLSLTLRSYDAAPLCTLQAGTAISPPTAIIQKPFYISIEMNRETFVSPQLQVSALDPGRYGTPPPGHVALDHAANFAVLCHQKVALLTLYYEIKEQINVLGVASSYVLINRLDFNIMAAALVVPEDRQNNVTLRPKSFKIVPPTKEPSVACGLQMCKFFLRGRWRGGNPAELRAYLCLNLSEEAFSARNTVPVRLGQPPLRRAVALVRQDSQSIPIVVTQMKRDSHWVVVVAEDPCPQFVVHNQTDHTFAVGQPVTCLEEPTPILIEAVPECPGAKSACFVSAKTAMHYSTPAYSARFPPLTMPPATVAPPRLIFAKVRGEADHGSDAKWCTPVVVADGMQLLQFHGGLTIKLRVRTHPHSTLLELQDVDQNDISASDIRRRLQGAFKQAREPATTIMPEVGEAKEDLGPTRSRLTRTSSKELFKQPEVAVPTQPEVVLSKEPEAAVFTEPETTKHHPELGTVNATPVAETIDLNNSKTELNQSQQQPKQPPPEEETEGLKLKDSSSCFQAKATHETVSFQKSSNFPSEHIYKTVSNETDLDDVEWEESERFRCVVASVAVELAEATDVTPLLALHLDRTALLVQTINKKLKTTLSIADAQIDNLQYDTGQYDFAVVASTRAAALEADRWPPMWNMFGERETFSTKAGSARLLLKTQHDQWEVNNTKFNELTELEVHVGTLALYVEDAYVKALVELSRRLVPAGAQDAGAAAGEERSLQRPLRLRLLHVRPLDLTLTLHTAARMYIALDQSPLRLSAFKLHDMMTSAERLTHALTVHYLSAAILGAGWVVGGLELLGAPGALAARVGGATGGVRGVASAAAAALLRSLSAWAGSLARNLDLLAGDEEHARRAAAARRRPPPSLLAGLMAGITNFAINILGAVGGLAHHPLVGVAVGETESGAAALRRGLLGALTKPLSATADLVAYAGSGLLRQTGWDPVPEPRDFRAVIEPRQTASWERDCVRWMFRLGEVTPFAGYEVLLEQARLHLLITRKFLVVTDPETERIVEMIDFRYCTLGPYQGAIIQLIVRQTRNKPLKLAELSPEQLDDEDDCQISATAMARVARYTGAPGSSAAAAESRVLLVLPPLWRSHALHCALAAALHHSSSEHFPML